MGYLEGEPVFTITSNMGRFQCTPDNTTAYVHDDRFKDVDHIFRYTQESQDDIEMEEGIFVFRALFGVIFNPLVHDMEELGYTIIHHDEPTDLDWQQYLQFSTGDVNKYWKHLAGTGGKRAL